MEPTANNTFTTDGLKDETITVVGDEKQSAFLPRVKFKKWDNEVNFSLGLEDSLAGGEVKNEYGVVSLEKGNVTARFYELFAQEMQPLTSIRCVSNMTKMSMLESTSEYELLNHICTPGAMYMSVHSPNESGLVTFDLMSASQHLQADDKSTVKDFDYPDKSAYHPSDVPIPKYDRLKLGRLTTPYTPFVNPLYADEGMTLFDAQWHGTELGKVTPRLMTAIATVLEKLGVKVIGSKTRYKLYYKHGDRWVKFFSSQEQSGQWLYAYLNFDTAYNKAYDFYRPDVEKDIRDQYAYGLMVGHPELDRQAVTKSILEEFTKLMEVPFEDNSYTAEEVDLWKVIQKFQDSTEWTVNAKRKDAFWFKRNKRPGFEFEVVFAAKPSSNEVKLTASNTKNVTAYYQAEYTFEYMIKERVMRPPDIQKSIAIYHSDESKRGDGSKYKNGKVMHIERPIAHDIYGYSVFCDFKETEGLEEGAEYDLSNGLTIVVPQDFLDSATYPVTVDPTFGATRAAIAAGTAIGPLHNTDVTAPAISPSSTGFVSSISVLVAQGDNGYSSGTSAGPFYGGVYNGTSVGPTYSLLGTTQPAYSQWNSGLTDAPNNPPPSITDMAATDYFKVFSGTAYAVAFYGDTTIDRYSDGYYLYYDGLLGTNYRTGTVSAGAGLTNTIVWTVSVAARQICAYVTYGYQYPIMAGNNQSMPSTDSYTAIAGTVNTGYLSTVSSSDVVMPLSGTDLTNFAVSLGTAPSAGQLRYIGINYNDAGTPAPANGLYTLITDTATYNSNSSQAQVLQSGDTINMFSLGNGTTPTASTKNKWRVVHTATNQIFITSTVANVSTSVARYVGVQDSGGASATAGNTAQVFPVAGTIQTITARINTALTAGSYTITPVWSGGSSAISIVLDSSNQSNTSAGTISIAAGDTLYWVITPSVGTLPSVAAPISITCEFANVTPAGTGVLFSGNNLTAVSNSVTWYSGFNTGGNSALTWASDMTLVTALAYKMVITGIYVLLSAAPGAGKTRNISIVVNGVTTTATVSITGASATTGTWAGRLRIATDDLVCVSHTPVSSPTSSTKVMVGVTYTLVPQNPGSTLPLMGVG